MFASVRQLMLTLNSLSSCSLNPIPSEDPNFPAHEKQYDINSMMRAAFGGDALQKNSTKVMKKQKHNRRLGETLQCTKCLNFWVIYGLYGNKI